LKLLDEALKDLEMGAGNKFLSLRGSLLDAQGEVRKDIFKPKGDIHLNTSGTQIVSMRIQQMLTIMLPNLTPVPAPVQTPLAPVQTPAPTKPQRTRVQAPVPDPAPVVVNPPSVVGAPLVAAVVNAHAVAQAPAGVQQLVGQVQDLVIQHVAVVSQDQVGTPMEVEDEDSILQRLFFKKYGRALPEEKEKESDVDNINFVIDLTDEKDENEMEVATSEIVPAVVKTEPIEAPEAPEAPVAPVVNVADATKRRSFRLERIELAKARKAINEFGKSLRKKDIIPEKEPENVIATDDTDMAEDVSVNEVNTVNPVGPVKTYEQVMAEIDAAIEDNTE
jgi:hypothetical protein